jgi:hypothetical protein
MSVCACQHKCGDVAEEKDVSDAVCKNLPRPPKPPLVEIVLVPRRPAVTYQDCT